MVVFLVSKVRVPADASLAESLAVPGPAALVLTIAAAMFINQGVNPNWYGTLTDINLPEHRATMISLASVMDMLGKRPRSAHRILYRHDLGAAGGHGQRPRLLGVNVVFWLPVLVHVRADLDRSTQSSPTAPRT